MGKRRGQRSNGAAQHAPAALPMETLITGPEAVEVPLWDAPAAALRPRSTTRLEPHVCGGCGEEFCVPSNLETHECRLSPSSLTLSPP